MFLRKNKRMEELEAKIARIDAFLPTVELWVRVLAEQFKRNRDFIMSLEPKPEATAQKPEAEKAAVPEQQKESAPKQ